MLMQMYHQEEEGCLLRPSDIYKTNVHMQEKYICKKEIYARDISMQMYPEEEEGCLLRPRGAAG